MEYDPRSFDLKMALFCPSGSPKSIKIPRVESDRLAAYPWFLVRLELAGFSITVPTPVDVGKMQVAIPLPASGTGLPS